MSENEGHRERNDSPAPPPPRRPDEYRPPQPPSSDPAAPASTAHHNPDTSQSEDAEGPEFTLKVPDFLKSMKRSHWLTLLLSQAAGYVTLLLLALLSVIGLTIGLLLTSEEGLNAQAPDMAGMDFAPSVFLLLIMLPFQIAATWLLGTLGFSVTMHESMTQMLPAGDGMGGTVWAPNLLYLVLALVVARWVGRMMFKRSHQIAITEVPRLARLVANAALALAMAGVTLLVTWISALRQGFSLADLAGFEGASGAEAQLMAEFLGVDASETVISMSGHAAGASLFLTAFIFYLLIGLVLSAGGRSFALVRKKVEHVLPSAYGVPGVLATHALIIGVPAVIYLAVVFTIDAGPVGVLSILLWGFSAAIFSFVLLNFGAVSLSDDISGFGQADSGGGALYLWTGDFAWWEVVLAILLGLVAIAVASLVWALRRDSHASTLRKLLSWMTLPLIYAVVGAVLTMFGQIRGAADLMGVADASFHLGPVWWTFAVLLLIGMVIEALSRFAAPLAEPKLPSGLRRLLGGAAPEK